MRCSACRGVVLAVGLGVLGGACATVTVRVPITRPAEVNLGGKDELVIGDIQGHGAAEVTAVLKQAIVDSGRFKLVDRAHLNQVLQELRLSVSDLADPASRRKLGKIMTGSILVAGAVDHRGYSEDVSSQNDTCQRTVKTNARPIPYPCVHRARYGRAEVAVSFDVIDVETGENLKPKHVGCKLERTTRATDGTPAAIDGQALIDQCTTAVVERFMKAIAPWQDYANAPFLRDGDLPVLEVGINYAKQGMWDDAIAKFQQAVEQASGRPDLEVETVAKATWDLGLAYEYTFRFDEAIEQVKKAYDMTQNEQFLSEVAAIEKLRDTP